VGRVDGEKCGGEDTGKEAKGSERRMLGCSIQGR
jgi:hypothetical protein